MPPPLVANAVPRSGPVEGGTEVTIVGQFFQDGAEVYFGQTEAAEVDFRNPALIIATTPEHAAGIVAVRVVNPDGQAGTRPGGFTFFPPIPPPEIFAVAPNFGPVIGGALSSITGQDFQAGAQVFVGDAEGRRSA